ncbi:hypothetical protein D5F11_011325 [Siminovitchia terrae]|uniref:Uncharacterized protein n=1 Tax=Siminovitchia terrae TaxID=1914933 RepID=A0A429X8I9_SIMTE|nr:hypothetical protein [Siminovitchia terrae]RST59686.1 hypothetical protein D5F11_011325 [Siminovitchia terrae]
MVVELAESGVLEGEICYCDSSKKIRELREKWSKAKTLGEKIKIELQMAVERIENKKQLEAREEL